MPYNIDIDEVPRNQIVYTLTSNEIWMKWSTYIEEKVKCEQLMDKQKIEDGSITQNDYDEKWNNPEKIHELRQTFSKLYNIPLLYGCNVPLWQFIFEVLHFKLRFCVRAVAVLVQLFWCVFRWTLIEIKLVLAEYGMYSLFYLFYLLYLLCFLLCFLLS